MDELKKQGHWFTTRRHRDRTTTYVLVRDAAAVELALREASEPERLFEPETQRGDYRDVASANSRWRWLAAAPTAASATTQIKAARAGIEVSMGSVGDCYDNAVCETFHASLKKERIDRQSWPTRAAARTAIFEYIEGWYNPRRRHSTLGYLSPIEFEGQAHRAHPTGDRRLDFGRRIGRVNRAESLKRAYNASRLNGRRRFRCPRPDLARERPGCPNRSRSGRDERQSKDEPQPVASPLGSQGPSTLIQQHQLQQPRRVVQTRGGPDSSLRHALGPLARRESTCCLWESAYARPMRLASCFGAATSFSPSHW